MSQRVESQSYAQGDGTPSPALSPMCSTNPGACNPSSGESAFGELNAFLERTAAGPPSPPMVEMGEPTPPASPVLVEMEPTTPSPPAMEMEPATPSPPMMALSPISPSAPSQHRPVIRAPGKRERITLKKFLLGDKCFTDPEAKGCKQVKARCYSDNVRSGMCNLQTVAVPFDSAEGRGEEKYGPFSALDADMQVLLHLKKALFNYNRAVTLFTACSGDKFNWWWDIKGSLEDPPAEFRNPDYIGIINPAELRKIMLQTTKEMSAILAPEGDGMDGYLAPEYFSGSKRRCPQVYVKSKNKAAGAAKAALDKAHAHIFWAALLFNSILTTPVPSSETFTSLLFLNKWEMSMLWLVSNYVSRRGHQDIKELSASELKGLTYVLRVEAGLDAQIDSQATYRGKIGKYYEELDVTWKMVSEFQKLLPSS